ncbi:hypothetical protein MRX96_042060 [Rhipicephalus microplus]
MTSTSSNWESPAVVMTEDDIALTSSGLELLTVVETGKMTSSSSDWEPPAVVKTEDDIAPFSSVKKPPAVVKTQDEISSTSSDREPPENGTDATALGEIAG